MAWNGEKVSLTTLDNSFDGSKVRIQSRTPSNLLGQQGQQEAASSPQLQRATAAVEPLPGATAGGR